MNTDQWCSVSSKDRSALNEEALMVTSQITPQVNPLSPIVEGSSKIIV